MTLIKPCKQSTVLGTRMTLAPLGTESSSSLQMMTKWLANCPSPQEILPTGLTLSSGDLSKRRLDLGVERVSSHDEDDRHVLVDKREWSVLELTSEDLSVSELPTSRGSRPTPSLCMYETSLIFKAPSKQVASVHQFHLMNKWIGHTLITSTHDEQTLLVGKQILGQSLQCLVHSQDFLDLSGDVVQSIDNLLSSGSLEDRVVA